MFPEPILPQQGPVPSASPPTTCSKYPISLHHLTKHRHGQQQAVKAAPKGGLRVHLRLPDTMVSLPPSRHGYHKLSLRLSFLPTPRCLSCSLVYLETEGPSPGGLSVLQADARPPILSFANLSRLWCKGVGALRSVSAAVIFPSLSSPHTSLSFVCAFAAWAEIDKVS